MSCCEMIQADADDETLYECICLDATTIQEAEIPAIL